MSDWRSKPRQRSLLRGAEFTRGVLAGKSQKQAALDAGYAPSSAKAPSERIIPYLPGDLAREIRRAIAPRDIARVLRDGINATDTKVGFHEGQAVYSEPLADHKERRQAAELAAKLGGMVDQADHKNEVMVNVQVLG